MGVELGSIRHQPNSRLESILGEASTNGLMNPWALPFVEMSGMDIGAVAPYLARMA